MHAVSGYKKKVNASMRVSIVIILERCPSKRTIIDTGSCTDIMRNYYAFDPGLFREGINLILAIIAVVMIPSGFDLLMSSTSFLYVTRRRRNSGLFFNITDNMKTKFLRQNSKNR